MHTCKSPGGRAFFLFTSLCLSLVLGSVAFADNANVYPPTVPTVDLTSQYRLLRIYPQRKFDCPVALAIMPGQIRREMLMLQRGEVWQLPPNRLSGDAELFLDFREKLKSAMLFEEGFHGLAFHPEFAKNGKF